MKWIDRLIIAAVTRRLSAIEEQFASDAAASRERVVAALAEHETSLTSHLSSLERTVLAILSRSDSDRLSEAERTAAIHSAFGRTH
jgi:hypothetical protein